MFSLHFALLVNLFRVKPIGNEVVRYRKENWQYKNKFPPEFHFIYTLFFYFLLIYTYGLKLIFGDNCAAIFIFPNALNSGYISTIISKPVEQ